MNPNSRNYSKRDEEEKLPQDGIYSVVNEKQKKFVLLPVDLAARVERAREHFVGPWLLLSGTMDRYITERLFGGWVHWHHVTLAKFGQLSVYYAYSRDVNLLTTRFDVGRNEEMYKRYAAAIPQVLKKSKGPLKLVTYPSYAVMKGVASYYTPPGGEDVVEVWEWDKKKSKKDVMEAIKQGKTVHYHAVAFGKYAEGVEFSDDAKDVNLPYSSYIEDASVQKKSGKKSLLRTVVVAGVPIPNIFNDYYVDLGVHFGFITQKCAKELYRVADLSEASKECRLQMIEWGYKQAEIAIRQIVGRAIRGPADSATLYILDTRAPRSLINSICQNTHFDIKDCRDIPAEELLSPPQP